MKTNVYVDDPLEIILLWEGDYPVKLQEDDIIFIGDGWGGCRVNRTYIEMNDPSQEVYVSDNTREMREHVKKYGLFNITRGESE